MNSATIFAHWQLVNEVLRLIAHHETAYCMHGVLLEDDCDDCTFDAETHDEGDPEVAEN